MTKLALQAPALQIHQCPMILSSPVVVTFIGKSSLRTPFALYLSPKYSSSTNRQ